MFPKLFLIPLNLLLSTFIPPVSSLIPQPSPCNQHQIHHFLNSSQEPISPQPQNPLSISVPPQKPLQESYPKIYPPSPTCADISSNRPPVPNSLASTGILDFCTTYSHSLLKSGTYINKSYPIPTEASQSSSASHTNANANAKPALYLTITFNPKCGRGKTRINPSRCQTYLHSLLEQCNSGDEERWGGEVVGTCLVYGMSSGYVDREECGKVGMEVVVNGTILVAMNGNGKGEGRNGKRKGEERNGKGKGEGETGYSNGGKKVVIGRRWN